MSFQRCKWLKHIQYGGWLLDMRYDGYLDS